jgi:hypothetical protein
MPSERCGHAQVAVTIAGAECRFEIGYVNRMIELAQKVGASL